MTEHPFEEDFTPDIQRGFAAIRKTRGTCPDSVVLSSYVSGTLARPVVEEIERHLSCCGLCDAAVLRVREAERAWDKDPSARREGRASRLGWLVPAMGYALALVLVYPAYVGINAKLATKPTPPIVLPTGNDLPNPATPIKGFNLNLARDSTSGGNVIQLALSDDFFVIWFFVPAQRGVQYRATISDTLGHSILASSPIQSDAEGNSMVICRRTSFAPGRWFLTVSGARDRFVFPFLVKE
jgi:hypothetical protein